MQSELKACPWCKEGNCRAIRAGNLFHVYCFKCEVTGPVMPTAALAIAAWNTRAEGDARDAARYCGIRHAMANGDEHFLELLEQHLNHRGLLDRKFLSETEIDAAFDAALKTPNGEGK